MRFILVGKVVDEWLDVRVGDLARLFGEALPRFVVPFLEAELRREERWTGIIDAASKKEEEVSCQHRVLRAISGTLDCQLASRLLVSGMIFLEVSPP